MLTDFRNALRSLRAAPSFTAVALLVLTLGIGATTAIFSIVHAVVLRALPFDESDRLVSVTIWNTDAASRSNYHTPQDFADWRDQQDVFSAITAAGGAGGFTLRDGDRPENLRVQQVTAGFFDVFRATPRMGRPFTEEHEVDGRHHVAVISDGLWRRRFGADADVVGQTMTFDSGTWEIIGVMPRGFEYPVGTSRPTDMWVPFVQPETQKTRGNSRNHYLQVVGRLDEAVSLAQADERMRAITNGLAEEFPDWFKDRRAELKPFHEMVVGAETIPWMLMLLGSVAFVLLIACVNVANLVLARSMARAREIGVRAALGASRWQIARGMLAESLVLSAAGTACALVLAWWGVGVLKAALPENLPRIADISIDLRVLATAAAAALVTGVIFGLAPAIRFSKPNLTGVLREGGRGAVGSARQLLRSTLVVAEVALAVVLLVGAGLFLTSFIRLVNVDIGLNYENVLTVEVYPRPPQGADEDIRAQHDRAAVAFADITERIQAVPGVRSVGLIAGGLPLSGSWSRTTVRVPGREEPFSADDSVDIRQVTAGYGAAIDAPVLRGRYVADTDGAEGQPVVVLNEEAAARYLPDVDPIGATININGDRTVVGVVGNVRLGGPESDVRPEAYIPFSQSIQPGAEFVVRTDGDPALFSDAVTSAVRATYPDLAINDTTTMESLLGRLIARRRFNMLLVGLFGVLAVAIAAAGIYGVMAYIVAQRTPEIGVRMALGAQPRRVLLGVLGRASVFLALGLAVGLAGAWVVAGSVEAFLFQIQPHEPSVYVATSGALLVIGLVAALVPARRAARVDPLIALRDS
jgi:putative ABC transport system permease protein